MEDQVIPQSINHQTLIVQTSSTDIAHIKLLEEKVKKLETENKKVKTQNANLRKTNRELMNENREPRSVVEDEETGNNVIEDLRSRRQVIENRIKGLENLRSQNQLLENKIIGLEHEDRCKGDRIKELEDLLQLHHYNCVEEIDNPKSDKARQAEMDRRLIETQQAIVSKFEERVKQLEKEKSDLVTRSRTEKKQLESQSAKHQSQLKRLTDEKGILEQEKEKILKRCSELESRCDNKDEQMRKITTFLAQAKDLVRGAEQILKGPKDCNTSDSSVSESLSQKVTDS
ncbi:hypothetical protein L486_01453 [Kwoniella mangroviensis CBS 10435]|uniref:Uncharacterized protein n=1 Tax=Kwoniella mangroviensis CBS 10435 TaxID=1331196 RepID=A0A1B9J1Y5_9TREE|nr:hypothetical protein L486_01453 [Kwoniella mangroviensis CBS 10435]